MTSTPSLPYSWSRHVKDATETRTRTRTTTSGCPLSHDMFQAPTCLSSRTDPTLADVSYYLLLQRPTCRHSTSGRSPATWPTTAPSRCCHARQWCGVWGYSSEACVWACGAVEGSQTEQRGTPVASGTHHCTARPACCERYCCTSSLSGPGSAPPCFARTHNVGLRTHAYLQGAAHSTRCRDDGVARRLRNEGMWPRLLT